LVNFKAKQIAMRPEIEELSEVNETQSSRNLTSIFDSKEFYLILGYRHKRVKKRKRQHYDLG